MNLLRGNIEASLRGQIADSHKAIQSFCDSKNNNNQSARSANLIKSFCCFWLSPKAESPLPLNFNLPSKVVSHNLVKNDLCVSTESHPIRGAMQDSFCLDCHENSPRSFSRNDEFFSQYQKFPIKDALCFLNS